METWQRRISLHFHWPRKRSSWKGVLKEAHSFAPHTDLNLHLVLIWLLAWEGTYNLEWSVGKEEVLD